MIRVGTDILAIERMKNAINSCGARFLQHVFTPYEIEKAPCVHSAAYYHFYTKRFVAKEAMLKAIGVDINRRAVWQEIEIRNTNQGRPFILLQERLLIQTKSIYLSSIYNLCQICGGNYRSTIVILSYICIKCGGEITYSFENLDHIKTYIDLSMSDDHKYAIATVLLTIESITY